MSDYQITREGQELGSFDITQIQEGLQTGYFQATDWGWREGMDGWLALPEIAGAATAPQTKAIVAPSSLPARQPLGPRQPTVTRQPLSPMSAPRQAESFNPYTAPASSSSASPQLAAVGDVVPAAVLMELAGTRPWVRLISVLMWIGCAITVLFIVLNLLFGLAGGTALMKSGAAGAGMAIMLGVTIVHGIMALLIIYPTLKLSKYASNITRLTQSRSFVHLTAALAEQRRFWKFYGILILIYLGFAALFVLVILANLGSAVH